MASTPPEIHPDKFRGGYSNVALRTLILRCVGTNKLKFCNPIALTLVLLDCAFTISSQSLQDSKKRTLQLNSDSSALTMCLPYKDKLVLSAFWCYDAVKQGMYAFCILHFAFCAFWWAFPIQLIKLLAMESIEFMKSDTDFLCST